MLLQFDCALEAKYQADRLRFKLALCGLSESGLRIRVGYQNAKSTSEKDHFSGPTPSHKMEW